MQGETLFHYYMFYFASSSLETKYSFLRYPGGSSGATSSASLSTLMQKQAVRYQAVRLFRFSSVAVVTKRSPFSPAARNPTIASFRLASFCCPCPSLYHISEMHGDHFTGKTHQVFASCASFRR